MFRSYLAAALRNLMRNKLVSTINIVGLALGIAAALMIGLYLRYHLTYEHFLPGHEQVYRLSLTIERPESPVEIWDTADPYMSEFLELDYPEVTLSARIGGTSVSVQRTGVSFPERLFFADPDFFRILPFPAIAGDLAAALDSPDGLVITRSTARKYFGDENPLGQALQLRMGPSVDMGPSLDVSVRVLAVIEDLPGNTHFNFKMIASGTASFAPQRYYDTQRDSLDAFTGDAFTYFSAHTYFRLREGATVAHIESDAQKFFERHYPPTHRAIVKLDILPISRVHLSPPGRFAMSPAMNPRTLWTLGLIGFLVILLAAINFVNLMTALAAQRAVEVGVRKSAGARRADLIAQFLGEACLYVVVSVFLAIAMVELALPTFNAMLSTDDSLHQATTVSFHYWRDPALAIVLLLAALVLSVLAGAYPAFVISAMRPANALQRGNSAPGSVRVRRILVVLQLAILIALIFVTSVIHRQTAFAMGEALRIDRNQVLLLTFFEQPVNTAFMDAIAGIPGVSAVTASSSLPTNYDPNASKFSHAPNSEPVQIQISNIDFNFFEFYRLNPVAGRLPSRDRSTDLFAFDDAQRHSAVWVNESAVRALGMTSPGAAIGEQLKTHWGPTVAPPASLTIAGVIPDFPSDSVRAPIQPALYIVEPNYLSTVSIRLTGRQVPETLIAIDDVWKRLGEPRAVARRFLETYYQRMYLDIIQQRLVLGFLCAVAMFLACLGLFGLSIFTAQRRTKEIGIRKVMGARSGDIMRLLLWAFSKPVIWASLIAWPVAAWLMSRWLADFVYRVDLGWWLLPAASALALAITLATVSVHSFLVARAKPASALRYE